MWHNYRKYITLILILATFCGVASQANAQVDPCRTDQGLTGLDRKPGDTLKCSITSTDADQITAVLNGKRVDQPNDWSGKFGPVSTRFFGSMGDEIVVVCLRDRDSDSNVCALTLKETERQTLVVEQLKSVYTAATAALGAGVRPEEAVILEENGYCLRYRRANVTITVGAGSTEPPLKSVCRVDGQRSWVFFDRRGQKVAPNASTTDAGSSDNKSAAVKDVRGGTKAGATKGSSSNSDEVTVITGPIEHLFLAAAIPVNNVSTLKYDATSKSLIESKKPSAFFVALNIGFGDVVGTPTRVQDNFFGTLLVSASTRPLDSFGIGVGIKGRKFGDYLDLSALTFFYALTWNQSDVVNSSNKVTIGKKLRSSSQFGVGFNLNKAVEWLKKN